MDALGKLLLRVLVAALVFLVLTSPVTVAHRLEPISTQFARPFAPRTGSLQILYDYQRGDAFARHLIPAAELELGIFRRAQISVEMPLVRWDFYGGASTTTGGRLEIAGRYLLWDSEKKRFAISFNAFVEAPTGNRRINGDATEAGFALHFDREFGKRVLFHGNYGWATSIGGSEERERVIDYRSAFVFPVSRRWSPTVEFLGQTDTATGRTEFTVQPEMICYLSPHWEAKLGVPLGVTRGSPGVGVRVQVAWIFGSRGSH
jgi:hypothetical protein